MQVEQLTPLQESLVHAENEMTVAVVVLNRGQAALGSIRGSPEGRRVRRHRPSPYPTPVGGQPLAGSSSHHATVGGSVQAAPPSVPAVHPGSFCTTPAPAADGDTDGDTTAAAPSS